MNQVLNIFRKDLARCQWEIAVAVLGQLAVALLFPYNVLSSPDTFMQDPGRHILRFLLITGIFLLTQLAAVLLIVKLVQTENLVGDTQFWLTRPYEWPLLLAAKFGAILLFIYLPFVVVLGLIVHAAAHPGFTALYPHLLLMYAAIFLLPPFALATVTPNFVRFLGTGIGATIAGLIALTVARSALSLPIHGGGWVELVLSIAVCTTVIVMQYSSRSLKIPRLLLFLVPILLFTHLLPSGGDHVRPHGDLHFQFGTPPPNQF